MKTTLSKHGDGYALVLDGETMQRMGLTPDSEVTIEVHGKTLVMESAPQTEHEKKFAEVQVRMHQEHAGSFRRLAQ